MQKVFSIEIPDEIYINSWENNLTASFTYDGPETVYAVISNDSLINVSIDPYESDSAFVVDSEKYTILEINAETDTKLAHIIHEMKNDEYEYEYVDTTNHDGSTWAEITNYRLKDYYALRYDIDTDPAELKLEPIYNDAWELPQLIESNNTLEKLIYNRDNIEHNESNSALIISSIALLEEYIATIATARSWRYEEFDMTEIPSISKALSKVLVNKPIPEPEPIEYPPAVEDDEEQL